MSVERLTYRDANGEAWYSDAGTEADRLHFIADMENILGGNYDLNRLRELVEADRDRRCFTSHVRVGQTVWFVRDPKRNPENIVETTVEKIVYKHSGAYMKLVCNSMYKTSCNSIGKTVFFTREAAEAALKGEQHEKH